MPISVKFRLLPPKSGKPYSNPHSLQVRISIDGVVDPGFVPIWPLEGGDKLQVDPALWNVKKQRSSRRDDPVNEQIVELDAHIRAIRKEQLKIGKVTTKSIRYQLAYGQPPRYDATLTENGGWILDPEAGPVVSLDSHWYGITGESKLTTAYEAYIKELRLILPPTKYNKIAIVRWERGLRLLHDFEKYSRRPIPASSRITLNWLMRFHEWMQTQSGGRHRVQKVSAGQASRFIGKIATIFDYLIHEGFLTLNPVRLRRWERNDDKEIQFLEPHHVRKLFQLDWADTKGTVLWWFCLMCCTGMDYPDALAYARNRKAYERETPNGVKIISKRMKPPHEAFEFYKLPEVDQLFAIYPQGPDDLTAQCINRYTDQIESELCLDWRVTVKTARKTFGCLMLSAGYYVSEVSRMLGHKRISTTERHYVKVLGAAVDRGFERVSQAGGSW